jgi:N-acetylmuramoyl-L-alanine amidase
MAALMATAIILGVSVQTVNAAPGNSTAKLYSRVLVWQECMKAEAGSLRELVQTKINGISTLKNAIVRENNGENEITFVVQKITSNGLRNTGGNEGEIKGKDESLSRTDINFMREDIELLARIIYAEARGESFEGQVAVGAVVLNRLESPHFPKTIREVVYQPGSSPL